MKDLTLTIPTTQEVTPEQIAKSSGWAKYGLTAAINEVALNHKADTTIAAYSLPTDIAQLQQYDTQFAELKKIAAEIEAERKKDTDVVDGWKKRRMEAEKRVYGHIEAYGAALLPLKKQAAAKAEAEQARLNALTAFRTMAQQEYNDLQAKCALIVTNKVADLFARALESDKVTEINAGIMNGMKNQLTADDFTIPAITDNDAEKQAILVEIFSQHNPTTFVASYHSQLTVKFADFANAKLHKTEALQQSKYEQETATQAITEGQMINNMAATMMADSAAPITVDHKALKEAYEIDMPDNSASALAIMRAFISVDGWSKLRVKSVFNCKVSQMGDVLAKLKSEDNALVLQGITFKKIDKL